jgi:hypothetical protein
VRKSREKLDNNTSLLWEIPHDRKVYYTRQEYKGSVGDLEGSSRARKSIYWDMTPQSFTLGRSI